MQRDLSATLPALPHSLPIPAHRRHEKDKTICFGPHILLESKTKDKTWDGIPLTPQIEIKNSESKERRISFKYGNEDLNLLEQFGGEISVSHDYYLTVMI